MGVILISLYLIFALRRFLTDQPQRMGGQRLQHQEPIGQKPMPKVAMRTSIIYEITIKEQLDEQWAEWFSPLVIQHETNGNTTLSGSVRDQGELHGMLIKVRDLNLTLLAVNRIEHAQP